MWPVNYHGAAHCSDGDDGDGSDSDGSDSDSDGIDVVVGGDDGCGEILTLFTPGMTVAVDLEN